MATLFLYILGATAILIQVASIKTAFGSMEYHKCKKATADLIISALIFALASAGGVKGFFVALIATFAVTIYLKFFTETKEVEEPKWWTLTKKIFIKEEKVQEE